MKIAENYLLLDVRDADEYAASHVADAINLPLGSIGHSILEVAPDKNTTIYVYCGSGRRAGIAQEKLAKLGYAKIENLLGLANAARLLGKTITN